MTALLAWIVAAVCCADDGPEVHVVSSQWREDFETGRPDWQVRQVGSSVAVRSSQTLNRDLARSGDAAAEIRIAGGQAGCAVRLTHALPTSRVLDDLKLSLWFRSNKNGADLALRIQFPNQTDPETGASLSMLVRGDRYQKAPHWQRLECRTGLDRIGEQVRWLRFRYKSVRIDDRALVVDAAVIELPPLDSDETGTLIDNMEFGPVIQPTGGSGMQAPKPAAPAPQTVQFRLDQLMIEGRPTIPRIVPYHGEDPALLKQCGVNLVWIPNWHDADLLNALREHGLWAIAEPPRPVSEAGQLLDRSGASLVPFDSNSDAIVAWNFGTQISEESSDDLMLWIDQVRSADRQYQRPTLADIAGAERVLSRHLSMTGMSRHVLNTTFTFRQYRDWLSQRRKLARPGSFVWTWVQTEASQSGTQRSREAGRHPVVIDAEQVRLQVYAALAAGYRGIGFWTRTPLDDDSPASVERRLILTQLNLELELLEPWLSTGTLVDQIPVRIAPSSSEAFQAFPWHRHGSEQVGTGGTSESQRLRTAQAASLARGSELEAAVIRSGGAFLLLPVWYEQDAQFVPGSLLARDVRILVPGVPDTSFVWSVSTTKVQSLRSERVTGGIAILLPELDQTAAILISSDHQLGQTLRRKVEAIQARGAHVAVALSRIRLERIRTVNDELTRLGVGQSHAPQWLSQSGDLIEQAAQAYQRAAGQQTNQAGSGAAVRLFQQQDYDEAHRKSRQAMQLLRILERAHWQNAVRDLSSPLSSQYTTCFQTLPDHWRVVEALGKDSAEVADSVWPEGQFDGVDPSDLISKGWRHEQNAIAGVRATAELALVSTGGNYALRLAAGPDTNVDAPAVIAQPPVRVSTPPVSVHRGQLIHVTGLVRVNVPVTANQDGFTLTDSLIGPSGGLRWNSAQDWRRFELFREVVADGDFTLTFTLHGMGEVLIDDLRLVLLESSSLSTETAEDIQADRAKRRVHPLEFLHHFPRLQRGRVSDSSENP